MKTVGYSLILAALGGSISSVALANNSANSPANSSVNESANGAAIAHAPATLMAAQTCGGCHGTQGAVRGTAFMPLAGMPEKQFIQSMKAFADGSRPSTLMGPLARSFSAEEIQAMAAYFAQFPKVQAQ